MAYQHFTFETKDPEQLCQWINGELGRIAGDLKMLELVEYTATPAKPFHGMRVIADGTNWNPGSGRGVYWYDRSTWKFLG